LEVDYTVAMRMKVTSRWNRFPAGPYLGKERMNPIVTHTHTKVRVCNVIDGNAASYANSFWS